MLYKLVGRAFNCSYSYSYSYFLMPAAVSRKTKKAPPPPEPEPEPTPAPDSESDTDTAPTFPNIVILKQTEHNYIVKHNIDPRADTSISAGNGDIEEDNDDLVTPNQIHKNQINKKRGRKPKAGLISSTSSGLSDITEIPNIILHLKCHMSDLKTNDSISNYGYTPAIEEVESYNISNTSIRSSDIGIMGKEHDDNDEQSSEYNNRIDYQNHSVYDATHINAICSDGNNYENYNNTYSNHRESMTSTGVCSSAAAAVAAAASSSSSCSSCSSSAAAAAAAASTGTSGMVANPLSLGNSVMNSAVAIDGGNSTGSRYRNINIIQERNTKEIMKKINRLKYSFHNGEPLQSKINHKSACFWDTCEFETQNFYIPVMIVNETFQVYGCFCSPECAVAFLLKESIDTSTKFERLHLIQLLYGNSSGRGIKPAPNPYYLLDKYYGNLTIHEYRQMLKGTQLIHIVNKPLTHILPELYEDNNDFLVNSKVIPTNNLKLKKRYKTMVVQNNDA